MMSNGFHEVRLPLRLSLGASGGPGRRTDIVALSNGGETRNARWADARRRYDVGTGLRGLDDLYRLIEFFEARRGQLYGFRFRDPVDHGSGTHGVTVSAIDQLIGEGDGARTLFELTKTYADPGGATTRRIEKPVEGSVLVAVDGAPLAPADFAVDPTAGLITIGPAAVPRTGAQVTAGFEFDIPVRLTPTASRFRWPPSRPARCPSVPLVEIKP
jgi:uncharacterized protein (TIGR02217 family)